MEILERAGHDPGQCQRQVAALGNLSARRSRFTGRVTVPVLWDKQRKTIVNNELSEIIRMFNTAFDALTDAREDFYPAALRGEIDTINSIVYANVNNGVYRAGFALTQEAYEEAFQKLFAALDELEARLGRTRYLVGDRLTEADGACSPPSSGSTPFMSATSSATCAGSPTIRTCRIICAISTSAGRGRDGGSRSHQAALLHEPPTPQPARHRAAGARDRFRGAARPCALRSKLEGRYARRIEKVLRCIQGVV